MDWTKIGEILWTNDFSDDMDALNNALDALETMCIKHSIDEDILRKQLYIAIENDKDVQCVLKNCLQTLKWNKQKTYIFCNLVLTKYFNLTLDNDRQTIVNQDISDLDSCSDTFGLITNDNKENDVVDTDSTTDSNTFERKIVISNSLIDNDNDMINTMNVLNTKILSIFPNITEVIINTTYGNIIVMKETGKGGFDFYPIYKFSMLSFLSSIKECKADINYLIKAVKNPYTWEPTWLCNIISPSIKQIFSDNNWNIRSYQERRFNSQDINDVDCLIISK
eukprot:211683_1